MGILLKGGNIITATDSYYADIRIEGEKIVAIGSDITQSDDEVISAKGSYIFPGGIDSHTHFGLDVGSTVTADDFYSGTKAAIVGGTTTILDYATQNKGETLQGALKQQFEKAEDKCFCDYGFHMGITDWNEFVNSEMADMVNVGITSFKLYMAYKKTLQVDDGIIYKALKRSKELSALIAFHCENGDIIEVLIDEARKNNYKSPIYHALTRPVNVEREAIARLLEIAELVDTPVYIVHLSSKAGMDCILDAKKRGVKVYVETCPQYLLLDESYYKGIDVNSFEGAKYVMSPPLRKTSDNLALWKGLSYGDISIVGTDHCSFNYIGQKDIGLTDFSKIPNGAPGVEHRIALLYTYGVLTGKININQMVALTSTDAAKVFGIFPKKGTIAVGSDADIIVWDKDYIGEISAKTQTQNVDYTPYEGFKQHGRVKYAFLRGEMVVIDGNVKIIKPTGKYLHRINGR